MIQSNLMKISVSGADYSDPLLYALIIFWVLIRASVDRPGLRNKFFSGLGFTLPALQLSTLWAPLLLMEMSQKGLMKLSV
jgi:hypothetical protein